MRVIYAPPSANTTRVFPDLQDLRGCFRTREPPVQLDLRRRRHGGGGGCLGAIHCGADRFGAGLRPRGEDGHSPGAST